MKGLCCVKPCDTGLYSTVVILPFFRKKLSFVILKGRKGELNTKMEGLNIHSILPFSYLFPKCCPTDLRQRKRLSFSRWVLIIPTVRFLNLFRGQNVN